MITWRKKNASTFCRSTRPCDAPDRAAAQTARGALERRSRASLAALRKAAAGKENLMPFIYDAVKAYATLGEICDAMRDVFGIYEEVAIT